MDWNCIIKFNELKYDNLKILPRMDRISAFFVKEKWNCLTSVNLVQLDMVLVVYTLLGSSVVEWGRNCTFCSTQVRIIQTKTILGFVCKKYHTQSCPLAELHFFMNGLSKLITSQPLKMASLSSYSAFIELVDLSLLKVGIQSAQDS